jgi:hypothetical protein
VAVGVVAVTRVVLLAGPPLLVLLATGDVAPSVRPWLVVAAAVAGYLASCAVFPWRRCWWCGGTKFRGDGHGNLRERGCVLCGGVGLVRRAGAVLLGMRRG